MASLFLDATAHLYKKFVRRSVSRSVRWSVGPVLFSNDEKHHFLCSDDNEIRHGPRDSQGQLNMTNRHKLRALKLAYCDTKHHNLPNPMLCCVKNAQKR